MMSGARSISSRVIVRAGVNVRILPLVSLKLRPRMSAAYMTASAPPQPALRFSCPSHELDAEKEYQAADVADQGMPPPGPLPITSMSGTTPKFSQVNIRSVRPRVWGISSKMRSAPWRSQAFRMICHYSGFGM